METENKKILLVEDDQNFGAILKDYLLLNDFEVTLAKNGMSVSVMYHVPLRSNHAEYSTSFPDGFCGTGALKSATI